MAISANEEFPFTETLAARTGGATAVHNGTMPNQALSIGYGCVIWLAAAKSRKNRHFRCIPCKIIRLHLLSKTPSHCKNSASGSRSSRKEDDTLVRGKGKYTDDFNLPGQAYAWIVRSSHAHGIIRGIDTAAAKAMPGVLGVWTGADLAAANYGPFTCGLPLKSRDGTPLLQTNRTALP